MAGADLKNLASPLATLQTERRDAQRAWRDRVGAAVERALQLAGKTQKEAWALLGHTNGAQLSRWCNGTERPQFDSLFAVEALRQPLAQALAEMAGAEVAVTVTIRRNG